MGLVLVNKSTSAPTNPYDGQVWIDTTGVPAIKVYDLGNTTWITISNVTFNTQTVSASGAATVTAGVKELHLDHGTQITAVIANAANHSGLFKVLAVAEPGTNHTVTLTAGTWDGTNDVAVFSDALDSILVYFDKNGNGVVLNNTGTVTFS